MNNSPDILKIIPRSRKFTRISGNLRVSGLQFATAFALLTWWGGLIFCIL